MEDNVQKPADPEQPGAAPPDEQQPAPSTSKPAFKGLLARQYMAVQAFGDPDDPEVQAYLADLEKVLNAPD
jgi:hypothetical protein